MCYIGWSRDCAPRAQPLADVVRHVSKGYRMESPEGCPSDVYELMRAAWQEEPQERPTFAQVGSHAFFFFCFPAVNWFVALLVAWKCILEGCNRPE
ncbi:hypothetical protein HPB48_017881 [Haemaphysalis longicornis]|uniref:Serine-threonine/tyrosine-protein kinase catalytic domain-containing protein n=1 Tax=Haemaphysalis longicornis TaxID=44386 RepID=A0A9J6GQ26_HAELO|nr:hypothetical protein HPB48_017881 [Haemaphysalis longicornis]